MLFRSLASEGFDRLGLPHLQHDFSIPALGPFPPVTWFALIAILSNLLTLGGNELVRRRLNLNNQRAVIRALMILNILGISGMLAFALSGNFFLAIAAMWCVGIFRYVKNPIFTTWLTRNSPARVRATIISLDGQMDAIGQIVGGPSIGYVGTIFSLRVALAAVSVILAPALLLYTAALRRVRDKVATESEEDEMVAPTL